MQFLGATIIAAVVFFVLSFGSEMVFGGPNVTSTSAFVLAAVKTAVFAVIFHYVHNFFARVFRWYRTDDPDAPHLFDRNPALDQARELRDRV
jgi:hypothetical protein